LFTRFGDDVRGHRLRREIISTRLTNSMIDLGGPGFAQRLADRTQADAGDIARAFVLARDTYRVGALVERITSLDPPVCSDVGLYLRIQRHLVDRTAWFVREVDLTSGLGTIAARFGAGVEAIQQDFALLLPERLAAQRAEDARQLAEDGVPPDLADMLAALPALGTATDAVLIAAQTGRPVPEAAAALLAVLDHFGVDVLCQQAAAISVVDRYEALVRDQALTQIAVAARRISGAALEGGGEGAEPIKLWIAGQPRAEETRQAIAGILAQPISLARISVAAAMFADLLRE
jgi:glutamate dehydrogenase